MRYCILLFAMVNIFIDGERCAYSQPVAFYHLTVEDGLSQSTVLAIAQDSEGFMWFGTREGLNRYDARNIKIYKNDPQNSWSLSDNFIYSLFSDSKKRLWVGTRSGLNLFNSRTERFQRFYSSAEDPASLSDNTVTCILEDRHKNLWIGTREGLNLLIEGDTISFARFLHEPDNQNSLIDNAIHSIFEDNDGVIWIGTSHGFSRLIYNTQHDYAFSSFEVLDSNGRFTRNNSINTFSEDEAGTLLVGTERNGILFFDKASLKFTGRDIGAEKLGSKTIRSILKDPSGSFWVGTIGGLFVSDRDFVKITAYRNIYDDPNAISDNSIRSLFHDRDGSFWIGTFHGGVNFYSPSAKQFRHVVPGTDGHKLKFKIASAITTDKAHNFWIGTEGNGLLFVDHNSNLIAHFRHDEDNINSLCHDNVKCLLLEEGKGIWIGTIKGLDFYDFRKKRFQHFKPDPGKSHPLPDDVIYDIIKDARGHLWIATYFGGIFRIDPERGVIEETLGHDPENVNTLSSKGATRLFIDSKKNLWAGTMSGLNKRISGTHFKHFLNDPSDTSSLSGDYIVSIFEDRQNRFWVGTRENGLNLLSENGKVIRRFSRSDGLPGNTVYAIQEDMRGNLWLSTERGLSRLDTENFTFRNFNRTDGLMCTQFNFNSHHKDKAGYLYFGGYNGVDFFHPDSLYENKVIPTIAFTGVRLF
ncbi:MAG TPA: two-component regulator propeller domain-containing protein, partial [Chryseosolibacter sp.]